MFSEGFLKKVVDKEIKLRYHLKTNPKGKDDMKEISPAKQTINAIDNLKSTLDMLRSIVLVSNPELESYIFSNASCKYVGLSSESGLPSFMVTRFAGTTEELTWFVSLFDILKSTDSKGEFRTENLQPSLQRKR